jgi:hypothetical protein
MTTRRFHLEGREGSSLMAAAMLVRGPASARGRSWVVDG